MRQVSPAFQAVNTRACLKNHSRHLHAPLRGIFGPNSVSVAHYASFIRAKSPTKCDAQLAESIFQTRSKGEQPPPQGSRAIRPNAGCVRSQCPQTIPPNVCEGDLPLRPENAILPLLRRLFALSPTDLCIIHLSLPAARSLFSGQAVKKSAVCWLHKGGGSSNVLKKNGYIDKY